MMQEKGFTLIELLIIIAIIAILVGIAATSGRTALNRTNVEKQVKIMFSDLMNAQASSIHDSRMYFVTLAPTQYSVFEDTDGGPNGDRLLNPALDRRVKQIGVSPEYAMTIVPAGVNQITFSQGMADTFPTGGMAAGVVIRVTTGFGSPLDCIQITRTKIRSGVWDGAVCR